MNDTAEPFIYEAVEEKIAWYTLAIKTGDEWGSAVAVKFLGRFLILTAGHVIGNTNKDELRFVSRPTVALKRVSIQEARQGHPMEAGRIMRSLPVTSIKTTDKEGSDIGIILLDSGSVQSLEDLHFYEITEEYSETPKEQTIVAMSGFPREIISTFRESSSVIVQLRFHTEYPDVVAHDGGVLGFDETKHFLMNVPKDDLAPDSDFVSNPYGMSGCGVWKLIKNTPGEVWRARSELSGIYTGIYPSRRLLKATKIEVIIAAIKSFLTSK